MSDFDDLGHPVFDADNHYYEALDAFTRHLDPALGPAVRSSGARSTGAGTTCSGGRVSHGGDQPDVRPDRHARGHVRLLPGQPRRPQPAGVPGRAVSPSGPAYREPAARLATLDEQGLAGCCSSPPWA